MARNKMSGDSPILIKKYANRRLYNTATSSYVTLDSLCQMVRDGADFIVQDARTKEDITHSVLTQIIVEEEAKGANLLPIGFLRQLICFYGDRLQALDPRYLESSMAAFTDSQETMRRRVEDMMGGLNPFASLEEMGRQNLAMFQKAMAMMTPGAAAGNGDGAPQDDADPETADKADAEPESQIDALRRKLQTLEKQIDTIAKKRAD